MQSCAVGCFPVQAGVAGAGWCRRVQTGADQAGACRCGGPGVVVAAVEVTMVVAAAVMTEMSAGAVWVSCFPSRYSKGNASDFYVNLVCMLQYIEIRQINESPCDVRCIALNLLMYITKLVITVYAH